MTEVVDDETVAVDEPYITLYNKYRPRRFSELVGQGRETEALRKTVSTGRSAHGYLFSGPRGTGKTTSARIMAAALNCHYVDDGEPCGECDICVSTFNGTFVGTVNELNATDQRGIDDVRQLLSSIEMSVAANYKVYIIDEVHQLTREASSLLLKMLEEPPSSSVRFILATTDPDKLLDTIRSRLVHIQFRLLDRDTLRDLVTGIAEQEGIEATDSDIDNVVAAGRGSARDAISALERTSMGLSNDNMSIVNELIGAILDDDLAKSLVLIAQADADGELNSRNISEDILGFWRDALVYQQSPDLVYADPEYLEYVKLGSDLGRKYIIRNFEATAEMLGTMRTAGSNRIALEGGIAKMLTPMPSVKRLDAILDRLDALDQKISSGAVPQSTSNGRSADTKNPWDNGELSDEDASSGKWPEVQPTEGPSENNTKKVDRTPPRRRSSNRRRRGTGRARRSSTRTRATSSRSKQNEDDERTDTSNTDDTERQKGRQKRQNAPSAPERDSIEANSENETPTSGGSVEETTPEEDKLFEQILESVSARSKTLIQEGSYGTNDDGVFTVYTERRVMPRAQQSIIDALDVDVEFEVIQ